MSVEPKFESWESAVRWLRNQPEQADLVRDAYYDDPLLNAALRYWESDEWQSIRPHLPAQRPATALDIGAGRGIASYALARDGYAVTALEPDGSALVGAEAIRGLAREAGLAIDVVQDFSEQLPFPDNHFDLVFGRAVLHHARDLPVACRELARVLKPGGCLVAVREHVISRHEDLQAFLDLHPLHHLYGGEHAYVLGAYEAAIGDAGLQVERVLAPLRSAINLAPQTGESLRAEIARRASLGVRPLRGVLSALLGQPVVWSMMLPLIERMDHRPGRLYSFVATKP